MAMGSTQPLTEMSTSNISWSKEWQACMANNITAICDRVSRECGSLDVSQPCATPWHNPIGLHGLLREWRYIFMVNAEDCCSKGVHPISQRYPTQDLYT
jgi:hypothetical protein